MSEYVCARCAKLCPTCCRMDPGDAPVCFPLSPAEAKRLAPYAEELGVPAGMPMNNSKEFVRNLRLLFPDRQKLVRELFPMSGEHLILPTSQGGCCLFLGNNGCMLPRDARPWYCRLFPLWFRKGSPDLFAAPQCLVSREAPAVDQALNLLGMDGDEARRLYDALCRDWGLSLM